MSHYTTNENKQRLRRKMETKGIMQGGILSTREENAALYAYLTKPVYKIHVGYTKTGRDKWKKFDTLEAANATCEAVRKQTGIILTIIKGE